jgi:hypothetical protein
MRRLIALAAMVALVTAACKIETNFGAVIRADGSGTIIFEVGMDDEAQGFFMQDTDNPFEDQDLADLPDARQRTERRGDMTFWILEADVEDIRSFQDDIVGDESAMLDSFTITITDDLVTVSGTASADDTFGGGDAGFDPQMLEDSISANIKITMPGSITSHNADSRNGNELTWRVPVTGGSLNIQAESDPTGTPASGGGGGIPIWVFVALAVVAALAVLYFLNKRRTPATAPAMPAESAYDPSAPPTEDPMAPPADE